MPINNQAEWQRDQDREDRRVRNSLDIRALESSKIEDRAELRRLMRRHQTEQQEVAMDDKLLKLREYQVLRAEQMEQDAKFAEAVLRSKNEKLSDETKRQQIRESSDELKILEARLKAVCVQKEICTQLAEKRQTAIQEKNHGEYMDKLLKESWENQKKVEEVQAQESNIRNKKYADDLRDQLKSNEGKKQMLFQDFLRDKRLIDGAVRKIQEEDEKAVIQRMEKLEKTKLEIENYKAAQAIWKQQTLAEVDEENRRIEAYIEKKRNEELQFNTKNKERENSKNHLNEKVGAQIFTIEKKKREQEEIIQAVGEQELLAAQERRYYNDLEKKLRDRAEMREAYIQQFAEKKKHLQREAAEGRAHRQYLLDKMAEDARIDQLTRERQRTKMIQFRLDVEKIMEQKRIHRAEEMQHLCHLEELAKEEEKKRRELIEDERLRMLKEHAKNLLGFFPAGILRESDLPFLGPEFVAKYGSKVGKATVSKK